MSLPSKLDTVPLVEVVSEFKFKDKKDIEGLFFDIYGLLKPLGYEYTKMPIMELPPAIREGDAKLEYQPYYRLTQGKYIISIGPKVLSFNIKGYYPGWDDFKGFILDKMEILKDVTEDWNLEKSSMRYINFFETSDIFEKLKITMDLPSNLCGVSNSVRSKVFFNEIHCEDDVDVRIQISNKVEIVQEGSIEPKQGSIIDLDAMVDYSGDTIDSVIDNLHLKTKSIFFGLLSSDFLQSLGPIDEDR